MLNVHIGRVYSGDPELVKLDLGFTPISPAMAKYVAKALMRNTTVTTLYLALTHIDVNAIDVLDKAILIDGCNIIDAYYTGISPTIKCTVAERKTEVRTIAKQWNSRLEGSEIKLEYLASLFKYRSAIRDLLERMKSTKEATFESDILVLGKQNIYKCTLLMYVFREIPEICSVVFEHHKPLLASIIGGVSLIEGQGR